ncbi:MAG: hypothetical protein ACRECO_05695 [Xanthobacteraceae bacterium]
MNQRTPEKIIPFAPSHKESRPQDGDPVDRSGQAIVEMLQEAVDVAKQNCERAMDIAHKLSLQLRAAEDRVAQLEGDARYYQERATRAEKWLVRIQHEIESKFLRENAVPKPGGR